MMGRVPSGGTPIVMPNLCVIKDAVLILFTSKLSKLSELEPEVAVK